MSYFLKIAYRTNTVEIHVIRMESASAQRNFWWEYWLPRDDIFLCLFFFYSHLTPLNQTTQETWPVIQNKKKKPKQNITVKDILSV